MILSASMKARSHFDMLSYIKAKNDDILGHSLSSQFPFKMGPMIQERRSGHHPRSSTDCSSSVPAQR